MEQKRSSRMFQKNQSSIIKTSTHLFLKINLTAWSSTQMTADPPAPRLARTTLPSFSGSFLDEMMALARNPPSIPPLHLLASLESVQASQVGVQVQGMDVDQSGATSVNVTVPQNTQGGTTALNVSMSEAQELVNQQGGDTSLNVVVATSQPGATSVSVVSQPGNMHVNVSMPPGTPTEASSAPPVGTRLESVPQVADEAQELVNQQEVIRR